jgi:hypothetical protein
MKTLTRQSGKPASTSRSQVSDIIRVGLGADRAPSISQSVSFCRSGRFMTMHLLRKSLQRQGAAMVLDKSLRADGSRELPRRMHLIGVTRLCRRDATSLAPAVIPISLRRSFA